MVKVIFLIALSCAGAAHADPDDAINRFRADDAAALVDAGHAVLLDVRDDDARALGHIRDDVHVPFHVLDERVGELSRERIVISYCACPAEETSLGAAEVLLGHGYPRVGVLVGGLDAWRALGRDDIVAERTEAEVLGLAESPIGWIKTNRHSERYRFNHRDGGLVIRGVDAADGEKAAVLQRVNAAPLRGSTVVFEVELALENVVRGVSIWLRAEDDAERVVAYRGLEPGPIRGSRESSRERVEMRVPDTASRLDFGVLLAGAGEVAIDNAAVTHPDGRPVEGPINLNFDR